MTDASLLDLHFDAPPVVEVIFGLEHVPVPGWKIPHLGLYWSEIREEYPDCEVLPPIVTRPRIELGVAPPVRCLFSNDAEQKVVQVQDDHFYYNWRKVSTADAYPEYSFIRPIFDHEWLRYKNFLTSQNLTEPTVTGCELTYVNHLRHGFDWDNLSELPAMFEIIKANSITLTPGVEQFFLVITIPLEGAEGATTLQIQPAVSAASGERIVLFTVSVKGRPASPNEQDVFSWFESAHAAIRFNFHRATTASMHQRWGLKEA